MEDVRHGKVPFVPILETIIKHKTMEEGPSLTTNKKLKADVEAWCFKQPKKVAAATVAETFPELKNYGTRSVIKIIGNAFKQAQELKDSMNGGGKRTAEEMMEAARSGAVLGKKTSTVTADDDDELRKSCCSAPLVLGIEP